MASEYLGTEERYAVFPFYLCLDVSQSMSGEPIAQVNAELPQIRSSVGQDPAVAEVIRFGVVTFSDGARTVLPLVDLALVESMPTVEVEGKTSYSAALGSHVPVGEEAGGLGPSAQAGAPVSTTSGVR